MNEFELSDQILDYMKSHSLESEQKGWGFRFKVHVRENAEVAFALTTNPTRMDGNYVAYNTGSENNLVIYDQKHKTENDKMTELRIRKLTPKEYWRLQGFTDEDFEKAKAVGISSSQLYKQAGNSICVPVVQNIMKNLLKIKDKETEIKMDEQTPLETVPMYVPQTNTDVVNHPQHYEAESVTITVQPIDLCEQCNFNLGNALKYIFRYEHKGKPVEDLKKAQFYLNRFIEKHNDSKLNTNSIAFQLYHDRPFLKDWDASVSDIQNAAMVLKWVENRIGELEQTA
jgi:hypothetical protein